MNRIPVMDDEARKAYGDAPTTDVHAEKSGTAKAPRKPTAPKKPAPKATGKK